MITFNVLLTSLFCIVNLIDLVENASQRIRQTRTTGYTRGGVRCQGGVSIPKHGPLDIPEVGSGAKEENTDHWIYQRWEQVPRRSKHPYKHGPLDIPEVGSGA
jgi:hypothetical protein